MSQCSISHRIEEGKWKKSERPPKAPPHPKEGKLHEFSYKLS